MEKESNGVHILGATAKDVAVEKVRISISANGQIRTEWDQTLTIPEVAYILQKSLNSILK